MSTPAPLDLNNIQGDILAGLPKKTETYFFFQVSDVNRFRGQFAKFVPSVTTTAQVVAGRQAIQEHKSQNKEGLIPMAAVAVAFSNAGLIKLGITDDLNDAAFTEGQLKGAENLGDPGKTTNGVFSPDWEPEFKKEIHGVIYVAGDSILSVDKKLIEIKLLFGVGLPGHSITEITSIRGDVRPGKENSAHEHFGFLDGISNPAVEGFDKTTFPGQDAIAPGFMLLGHETNNSSKPQPPSWAVDGSFLTFRYLFQLVPEFDDFLEQNPIILPGLSRKEGSELLGARLVGRWKSGAPIDITPLKDDPVLAADPQRNNDFKFENELNNNDQSRCPFAAHVRKTYPRDDLEGPPRNFDIDNRRIMRRGIQFGPEVTLIEKAEKKTHHGRGLLFACYSSSIVDGFQFIQQCTAYSLLTVFLTLTNECCVSNSMG
ncbi:hypothetical protein HGRIS_003305 [Hohenbuehelia grisea]|uniref:DyP dimeric alpha+beta barrel domain-containing protein n=1 Tax=Hohenbuehelia grisea TaxID=104357 RepID=A0ABR3JFG6_9AGAR